MLFIVNELKDLSSKKKFSIEFRETCEHHGERDIAEGYAFRVYDKKEFTMFLNSWLKKIGRECEKSSFKTFSDVVVRYNEYISRGGEPVIFDEQAIHHGMVYDYYYFH